MRRPEPGINGRRQAAGLPADRGRPIRPWAVPLAALCLLLVNVRLAEGQTQSLFGSRGPAGQIGSNLTGSLVGRSSTQGIGQGPGLGLTGQPLTGSTFGMGTTGGLQSGTAGTQQGFVGRRDNAGRFVGNQLAGQQTLSSAGRQGGLAGFGGTGRFGNRGFQAGARGFGQQPGAAAERAPVRPRQRIAFSYPQRSGRSIQQSLATRLARISLRQPGLQGINVTMQEDGVAVLRGQVGSEEDRRLAAIMVRLEPGVRSVQNELSVAPQTN